MTACCYKVLVFIPRRTIAMFAHFTQRVIRVLLNNIGQSYNVCGCDDGFLCIAAARCQTRCCGWSFMFPITGTTHTW